MPIKHPQKKKTSVAVSVDAEEGKKRREGMIDCLKMLDVQHEASHRLHFLAVAAPKNEAMDV